MSPPFVTTLRTPRETVRLAGAGADAWTIRVQLAEAWDAVRIEVAPRTAVAELKRVAVEALAPGAAADDAVIKLNGWEILDESAPLAESGARPGSTFLVHFRRRRPVR